MPMPLWLMDISLSLSLVFACLILMVTIFVEKPVDFSSYPLVLLIATMFRLSLNLATTRLILSNGNLGADAAGNVIKALGGFIMNGNFVIGVIVFSILVLVNFLVITKVPGVLLKLLQDFH
jgi:flagellar biosynthesis protein FlhA